jgi:hypothetical protein
VKDEILRCAHNDKGATLLLVSGSDTYAIVSNRCKTQESCPMADILTGVALGLTTSSPNATLFWLFSVALSCEAGLRRL